MEQLFPFWKQFNKKVMGMSELPKDWVETTLGEVATISSSKRIFHSDYVTSGIPFYRSKEVIERQKGNDISTALFITEKKFNEIKSKFGAPEKDDLLLTSVGTLGVPYLVKSNEIFYFKDGNLTWFRKYNGLNPNYIYHFFLSLIGKERLNEITIGSTQSALTISGLKNININLPPLDEQKSIADILSSFDDKIELLREQNKTLETLAQTLFKEWFVKFNFPNAIGEMTNSELGQIPKGWRVGALGDVTNIKGGGTPSTKNKIFWNGNIHWTSPKDLSNSKSMFLLDTEKKITEQGLKKISSGLLPKGTLLLSSRAPIGYLAFSDVDIAINQGYIALLGDEFFSNYFMYLWLKVNMKSVMNAANGSTFLEISKTAFKGIQCLVPNENTLSLFDELVKTNFDKILSNQLQIQTLEKTRDALLPKLMSGNIRVN